MDGVGLLYTGIEILKEREREKTPLPLHVISMATEMVLKLHDQTVISRDTFMLVDAIKKMFVPHLHHLISVRILHKTVSETKSENHFRHWCFNPHYQKILPLAASER